MELTREQLIKGLTDIAELYEEHRSDVSEIIHTFLETGKVEESYRESRFVAFSHKETAFQYDTLTTLVEYQDPNKEWKQIEDVTYTD